MSQTLIDLTVLQHDSIIRQLQEEQAARIVLQEEQAATIQRLKEEQAATIHRLQEEKAAIIRQLQEEKTARIQQQTEINKLKELTVMLQDKLQTHWHFVSTDRTDKTVISGITFFT